METKRFTQMLSKLQDLQRQAVLGGIDSFNVEAHYFHADPDLGDEPDELSISVTVWRTGDLDDSRDSLSLSFWESTDEREWAWKYNRLVDFVSDFLKQ